MPLTTIDSLQNPRIKRVKALSQKRQRDREGLFLLEGERELVRGLAAGIETARSGIRSHTSILSRGVHTGRLPHPKSI
jgi:hypothetical protein